jgi:hypothetical protein
MIRGEGTEVIQGVTLDEVWDFVLDPSQYTKADTKIIWVTKLGDTPDGMIGLEEGKFFGLKGSVVTRYRWTPDKKELYVSLVHGMLKSLNAGFHFEEVGGGVKIHHYEEIEMAFGPIGRAIEVAFGWWLRDSVPQEVKEIKRLMEAGERGKGIQ